jgi:very-short-patch-repair endonuclease
MRQGAKHAPARELRRHQTRAESLLWQQLRNRQLEGFKFVRQAPVGPYVADFLCREHKLVVEVDGATHSTQEELAADARRTRHLSSMGYRVIRFQNVEVAEGMDQVLGLIAQALARDV